VTQERAALRANRAERLAQYEQEDDQTQVEAAVEETPEPEVVEATAEPTNTEDAPEPEATEVNAEVEDAQEGTTPTDDGQSYVDATAEPAPETESAGQQLVAEVSPLTNVKADADVDMVLFQYDEANPHWAVFAEGQPVAAIHLADQPNPADLRPLFLSTGYSDTVKAACSKDGLQKTLEGIQARPYAVAMEQSEVVANLREEMKNEQADSVREARAEAAQDLMNALGLVLTAMNKNFIIENPLKKALYDSLSQVGVGAPVQTVEAAFEKAGPAFFEAAINQAREWAAYSPEAYKQIEDSVQKAASFAPAERTAAPVSPQIPQKQAAFPELPTNVPLETKTAGGQESVNRKESLRAKICLK